MSMYCDCCGKKIGNTRIVKRFGPMTWVFCSSRHAQVFPGLYAWCQFPAGFTACEDRMCPGTHPVEAEA